MNLPAPCIPERFLLPLRIITERLEIQGIGMEIMGAMQKRLPGGGWEEPTDVTRYREWVEYQGMRLPVLSLEYEHRAYVLMGRTEKAHLLEPYLATGGSSHD